MTFINTILKNLDDKDIQYNNEKHYWNNLHFFKMIVFSSKFDNFLFKCKLHVYYYNCNNSIYNWNKINVFII